MAAYPVLLGTVNEGNAWIDGRRIVRTGAQTLYAFRWLATFVAWHKSTDNGRSWSPATALTSGSTVSCAAIWYDQWTPGNSGTVIHIWSVGTTDDDVNYTRLDTATDTESGAVVIVAGTSATATAYLSGCRAVGGNLYVAYNMDGGTETGFYRSTDDGASWSSRSNSINEGAADYFQLQPGDYADTNDIDAFFWDISADAISVKFHDDSANSWAETAIASSMVEAVGPQYSTVVQHSDGAQFLIAWSSLDASTSDLICREINQSVVTSRTDVLTNIDNCRFCRLSINQTTGRLFAIYCGKGDGSESFVFDKTGVYYKYSDDRGVTWSAEVELMPKPTWVLFNQSHIGGDPHVWDGLPPDILNNMANSIDILYLATPPIGAGRGIGRGM